MYRRIAFPLILMTLCAAMVVACQQRLSIKMNEAIPPTFSFHAGPLTHYKHLTFFLVQEVAPENQKVPAYEKTSAENKTIWWIWPEDSEKGEFENLPAITYGKVPAGWTQKVPEQGEPPPLVEGKVYQAGGPHVEVPSAVMRFTIRNGKAVRLPLYREEFENQKSGND